MAGLGQNRPSRRASLGVVKVKCSLSRKAISPDSKSLAAPDRRKRHSVHVVLADLVECPFEPPREARSELLAGPFDEKFGHSTVDRLTLVISDLGHFERQVVPRGKDEGAAFESAQAPRLLRVPDHVEAAHRVEICAEAEDRATIDFGSAEGCQEPAVIVWEPETKTSLRLGDLCRSRSAKHGQPDSRVRFESTELREDIHAKEATSHTFCFEAIPIARAAQTGLPLVAQSDSHRVAPAIACGRKQQRLVRW